jgi:hypothetical protein
MSQGIQPYIINNIIMLSLEKEKQSSLPKPEKSQEDEVE